MLDLYVLNASQSLDDADCLKWLAAIKRSLDGDFAPWWNESAVLHFIGKGGKLDDSMAGGVFDDTPSSQYLGEHHLDKTPRFVVSVPTCKSDGTAISSVADHEIKELVGDETASLCEEMDDGTLLAREACDPTEGKSGAYFVDGVELENFVLPLAYFKDRGTRYDFRVVLTAPQGKMLPRDTYQIIRRPGEAWSQLNGEKLRASKLLLPGDDGFNQWTRRGKRVSRGLVSVAA